jgi:pyruvate kinase
MNTIQKKKTKIVATIGPASRKKEVLSEMVNEGLNVIRMNFSHGSHEDHEDTISIIKKVIKKTKQPIAILQDLSGPKIRLGAMEDNVVITEGDIFTLHTKKRIGNETDAFVNYKKLPQELKKGSSVKIDDGKLSLEVISTTKDTVKCRVLVGGPVFSNKGVNLPNTELSISSLTAKDRRDVLFGIHHEVDYIALSFVQTKKDILDLKKILTQHNSKAKIIAKIETTAAIENLSEILDVADGAMVARGDMAVEVGVERVPLIQKTIIKECTRRGKPVITATQMLDSMEKSPTPTRAEVSDVANAILDGSDAIMLSSESAIGKYPVETIKTMTAIALRTEPHIKNTNLNYLGESKDIVDTISSSVVRIANNVRARLIVCLTESGATPQLIARFNPHHPIIALTPHQKTVNQLQLVHGCTPVLADIPGDMNVLQRKIQSLVKKNNWAQSGEKMVITMGLRFGVPGSTNLIFVSEAK